MMAETWLTCSCCSQEHRAAHRMCNCCVRSHVPTADDVKKYIGIEKLERITSYMDFLLKDILKLKALTVFNPIKKTLKC